MDRRGLFKRAARQTSRHAVEHAERHVERNAKRWIRPPFALAELDFLLACTRCGDCVDACPHGVVFLLAGRVGPTATGTPALDLLNRGCHLCPEWPCVEACKSGALTRPQQPSTPDDEHPEHHDAAPLPQLALASVDPEACFPYRGPECGACAGSCPIPGALLWDQQRPAIDARRCVGCGLCREACVVEPKAIVLSARPDAPPVSPSDPEPRR